MLIYNPKDWFTFILKVHKSDTLRKLGPMILVIALYSIAIAYWEQEYLDITDHPWIKNIPIMHSLLGLRSQFFSYFARIQPMIDGGKVENFGGNLSM